MSAFPIHNPAPGPHATRQLLEVLIEFLIAALDHIDGDPDVEAGGDDEPSMCGVGCGGAFVDPDNDLEDSADDQGEPMLGASEGPFATRWEDGGSEDLEPSLCGITATWKHADSRDGEPELSWGDEYAQADQRSLRSEHEGDDAEDREPSLGVPESLIDQRGWGRGDASDREEEIQDDLPEAAFEPRPSVVLATQPVGTLMLIGSSPLPVHTLTGWAPSPVVLQPDARAAFVEQLEEEFDILGLGVLTPDRLAREMAVHGLA